LRTLRNSNYTNNKLLPVRGFRVPPEHLRKYDILNVPIDTDPRLTLQTRRAGEYDIRHSPHARTPSVPLARVVSRRFGFGGGCKE
jgi:hypothetical protein